MKNTYEESLNLSPSQTSSTDFIFLTQALKPDIAESKEINRMSKQFVMINLEVK